MILGFCPLAMIDKIKNGSRVSALNKEADL
jgi:hypothetical protein